MVEPAQPLPPALSQLPPQTANLLQGLTGQQIIQIAWYCIQSNDDAKHELYRYIKEYTGINAEPFLEPYLGQRKDKEMPIKDIDIPKLELAEMILDYLDAGYSPGQIPRQLRENDDVRVGINLVKGIVRERKQWEAMIKKQNAVNLPWHMRLLAWAMRR